MGEREGQLPAPLPRRSPSPPPVPTHFHREQLRLTLRHTLTLDPPTQHPIKLPTSRRNTDDLLPPHGRLGAGDERLGEDLVGGVFDLFDFDLAEALFKRKREKREVSESSARVRSSRMYIDLGESLASSL